MADNSNSAMTAVVVLIAIVVIAFLGFYALRMMQGDAGNGANINVDLPAPTGGNGQ